LPGAQAVQAERPQALPYVPAGHRVQAVCPAATENETSSTAWTMPLRVWKRVLRPCTSINAMGLL
jgi:hypothetical protein